MEDNTGPQKQPVGQKRYSPRPSYVVTRLRVQFRSREESDGVAQALL